MNFNKLINAILESNQPTMHVDEDGIIRWKLNGVPHREDGPAVIYKSGTEIWYINGLKHREDGPAIISKARKMSAWYKHGELHREDGPAVIHENGTLEWYKDGYRHKLDGPAVVKMHNGKIVSEEWWVNDQQLTGSDLENHKEKLKFRNTLAQKDDNLFDRNFIEELD